MELTDELLTDLFHSINDVYGYDFTQYSKASIKRRLNRICALQKIVYFSELQYKVLHDATFFNLLLKELVVNVTEMFRDPTFYKALSRIIIPQLSSKSHIRIWHAGCSTGEEVYSMAILLEEADLLERTILYGTDISAAVLSRAKEGIFPLSTMKKNSENYILSGGKEDFSRYYVVKYDWVKFDESLSRRMVFAVHNLVTDESFNEFDLIVCRNVLIYFEKDLQNRVIRLFYNSLTPDGFLALGSKESLSFSNSSKDFTIESKTEKIWKRK